MATDFSDWRRQHSLGVAVMLLQDGFRMLRNFVPAAIGLIYLRDVGIYAAYGTAVLAVGILAWSTLRFLRFRFRIDGHALQVEEGVLQRNRLTIPFDRIQAVQYQQSPSQRLLGVTGLAIDTAGSAGNELEFKALSWEMANDLRDALAGKAAEIPDWTPIVRLHWKDLIRHAITRNPVRNGMLLLVFPLSYFPNWTELLSDGIASTPNWAFPLLGVAATLLLIPFLVFLILLGLIGAALVVLNRYWGLHLQQNLSGQIHLQSGLIKRTAFTIQRPKIQTVTWRQNAIALRLGISEVQWTQARSGNDINGDERRFFIPSVRPEQVAVLDRLLFPTWQPDLPADLRPAPIYRAVVWGYWLLAATAVAWNSGWSWWGLSLAAFIAALGWYWSGRLSDGRFSRRNDTVFATYRGWRRRVRTLTQFHQVQLVEIRQPVWMVPFKVVHVRLQTAGEAVALQFLPEQEARAFADFVLHQVEASHEPWM